MHTSKHSQCHYQDHLEHSDKTHGKNVPDQYKTYQQIKNKLNLLIQQIMQILGIKNGRSVNSMTKIASSSLEARL